jgi:hypothetical protein
MLLPRIGTAVAALALASVSIFAPAAGRAATPRGPTPPAPCAAGDKVHTIGPGLYSIEPHPGFNPLTAPDSMLACYGYPPRPPAAQAAARSAWTNRMQRSHYVVPVVATMHGPPLGGLVGSWSTHIWTGYEVLYGDNGSDYYYRAEGSWIAPSCCTNGGAESSWVGLGGDRTHYPSSNVMWQAGTYNDGTTTSWIIDNFCDPYPNSTCYNQGYAVLLSSPSISTGQSVYVYVNASNGTAYLQNNSTGQNSGILTYGINNNNTGYTAEWIQEPVGCTTTPCTFPTWTDPAWSGAYAYGNVLSTYFTIMNYRRIDLYDPQDNNKVIAQPPAPNTTTHGYSETCCAF